MPTRFRFRFLSLFLLPLLLTSAPLPAQTKSKGKGNFTLYCIAEVKGERAASGGIAVKSPGGMTERFRLSGSDLRNANMQGTAVLRDESGRSIVINYIKSGQWSSLPEGWDGSGNKDNPLIPFRMVAADQGQHPYGSRVYLPSAKGFVTPEGETLDGYFWVGDSGSRIKGRYRFDVFIGDEPNYPKLRAQGIGRWSDEVEVEALPSPQRGLDYKNKLGRKRILEKLGYDVEGPLERVIEELRDIEDAGTSLEAALVHFQKQHPAIPRQEYKIGDGAVTRWFLAQAALAVSKGQSYPAGPSKAQSASAGTPKADGSISMSLMTGERIGSQR